MPGGWCWRPLWPAEPLEAGPAGGSCLPAAPHSVGSPGGAGQRSSPPSEEWGGGGEAVKPLLGLARGPGAPAQLLPFRDPRACAPATHSNCPHPVISKVKGSGIGCLESASLFHLQPTCPHCRRASKRGLGGDLRTGLGWSPCSATCAGPQPSLPASLHKRSQCSVKPWHCP